MASAARSCIALLTLVLLPVALYLAARLRPLVSIAETHSSLCAAALPPALMACYILGRPPLIRPWLSLGLLALVQSGGVSLAVLVLHRLFLRRVPLVVVPAVPELPTAAELAETRRRSAFAGCAARALLPEVPAIPGNADPPSQQPHAERLRRHRAPLGVAALLTLLLFACASPVPVKRTLLVRSQGEFALTLVFPGLLAHAAAPLLQADGAATCERLGTVATATALVSAQEETLPPKDEGAEPRSTTTIVGTLLCEVPR
jgi:hypothetical protein